MVGLNLTSILGTYPHSKLEGRHCAAFLRLTPAAGAYPHRCPYHPVARDCWLLSLAVPRHRYSWPAANAGIFYFLLAAAGVGGLSLSAFMGTEPEPIDWNKLFLALALLSGVSGGVIGLTRDTSDRYKGQDAAKDFELRDLKITYLIDEVRTLRATVQKIDDTHPPPDLVRRVMILEQHMHKVQIRHAGESGEMWSD